MARIRTVKPELFTSESIAECTVTSVLTFIGLLTQADDQGRHRDNAAIIAGALWPLRAEHTPVHVEDDLQQLANAGLICRYTGCNGKRYLHIAGWFEHQRIDKPSQSRLPACPHCAPERCGICKGPCTGRPESSAKAPGGLLEGSPTPPVALQLPARPAATAPAADGELLNSQQGSPADAVPAPDVEDRESPGHRHFAGASPKTPRSLDEPSAPGSRILDPGSSAPTGRTAPDTAVSANALIGEYVACCGQRPPGDVIGHLGRVTKKLLAEGIAPEHVRAGLRRFAEIQGHPSRLPSLVNDAMNARSVGLARPGFRPTVPAHQAWTNPVDAAAAYAEEL